MLSQKMAPSYICKGTPQKAINVIEKSIAIFGGEIEIEDFKKLMEDE